MDIPRYQFHSNIENDLLIFLKTANEYKNEGNCNFEEYEKLKLLYPLQEEYKQKLKIFTEKANDVIEIISDDETKGEKIIKCDDNDLKKEINQMLSDLANTSIQKRADVDYFVSAIKGSLSIRDDMPTPVLNDLWKLSDEELEQIFHSLNSIINLEEAEYFWFSICDSEILNEQVISSYIKTIFLPKAKEEYRDEIYNMFATFSEKYCDVFKRELVTKCLNGQINEVLVKYIAKSNSNFKTDLLRNIVNVSDKIESECIPVIEVLLNPETDANTQSGLIELMCNSAVEFINDNSYGKLLFTIVNSRKHLIPQWEPLLRNILSIHQSIWKIKVQKVIASNLNDSLTTSFR